MAFAVAGPARELLGEAVLGIVAVLVLRIITPSTSETPMFIPAIIAFAAILLPLAIFVISLSTVLRKILALLSLSLNSFFKS